MRIKPDISEEKKSVRAERILLDLCESKTAVSKLRNKGKEYDFLIDEIILINDGNDYFPSSKGLQAKYNLRPERLKKLLGALYWDFIAAIRLDSSLLDFTTVEHHISVHNYDGFALSFACRLPFTPRVGEDINIPFINGATDTQTGSFYVYKVDYELSDTVLKINLWVKVGFYKKHEEK